MLYSISFHEGSKVITAKSWSIIRYYDFWQSKGCEGSLQFINCGSSSGAGCSMNFHPFGMAVHNQQKHFPRNGPK